MAVLCYTRRHHARLQLGFVGTGGAHDRHCHRHSHNVLLCGGEDVNMARAVPQIRFRFDCLDSGCFTIGCSCRCGGAPPPPPATDGEGDRPDEVQGEGQEEHEEEHGLERPAACAACRSCARGWVLLPELSTCINSVTAALGFIIDRLEIGELCSPRVLVPVHYRIPVHVSGSHGHVSGHTPTVPCCEVAC